MLQYWTALLLVLRWIFCIPQIVFELLFRATNISARSASINQVSRCVVAQSASSSLASISPFHSSVFPSSSLLAIFSASTARLQLFVSFAVGNASRCRLIATRLPASRMACVLLIAFFNYGYLRLQLLLIRHFVQMTGGKVSHRKCHLSKTTFPPTAVHDRSESRGFDHEIKIYKITVRNPVPIAVTAALLSFSLHPVSKMVVIQSLILYVMHEHGRICEFIATSLMMYLSILSMPCT